MNDPLMSRGDSPAGTLWGTGTVAGCQLPAASDSRLTTHNSQLATSPRTSRSCAAGAVATKLIGSRRARIIELIRQRGGVTIFEAAEAINVGDNQISGRFSELVRDGLIRPGGQHRPKPGTDCQAEVYVLSHAPERRDDEKLLERLGYPDTLLVNGEPLDRGIVIPGEHLPGIPYSRRATEGGARSHWRLEFVESMCCGGRLIFAPEQIGGQPVKRFKCDRCRRVYELATAAEPGRAAALVAVAKTW